MRKTDHPPTVSKDVDACETAWLEWWRGVGNPDKAAFVAGYRAAHLRTPAKEAGEMVEQIEGWMREWFPEWDGDQTEALALNLATRLSNDTEAMRLLREARFFVDYARKNAMGGWSTDAVKLIARIDALAKGGAS